MQSAYARDRTYSDRIDGGTDCAEPLPPQPTATSTIPADSTILASAAPGEPVRLLPAGTIDITTRLEDGRAVLSVANTGPVIPPADIERLFQPFQRAAGRTGDGHGLGLSIIAAIATAHGAALTTRAQPHGGLHIQVRFPTTGRPQRQRTTSRPRKPQLLPGELHR